MLWQLITEFRIMGERMGYERNHLFEHASAVHHLVAISFGGTTLRSFLRALFFLP